MVQGQDDVDRDEIDSTRVVVLKKKVEGWEKWYISQIGDFSALFLRHQLQSER
jgi:hypothetical protein